MMPAKTVSKRRGMIWGLSLHGWEEVMRGFIAVVGVAGLIVGVATYFVVTLTREESAKSKAEFEEYKLESGAKISAAETAGQIAQADIAKAHAQIAEANARERVAQLKLEEVRKQLQPRQLNDEAFLAPLREIPPKNFKVLYVKDASDALFLAVQIQVALQSIGWVMTENLSGIEPRHSIMPEGVSLGSAASVGGQSTGVSAVVRRADMEKDKLALVLARALHAAFGSGAVGQNDQQPEDSVTIVIAPRL